MERIRTAIQKAKEGRDTALGQASAGAAVAGAAASASPRQPMMRAKSGEDRSMSERINWSARRPPCAMRFSLMRIKGFWTLSPVLPTMAVSISACLWAFTKCAFAQPTGANRQSRKQQRDC